MHPMSVIGGAAPANIDLFLPPFWPGVVESFMPWHVRLACQLLATHITYSKRVHWPQWLHIPRPSKRKSPSENYTDRSLTPGL